MCVEAPKSTAVPTLFPSVQTQDGLPKSISRLHSHLCHNGTKIDFALSCLGEAHSWSANRVWIPLYWPWTVKAARQGSACRFVGTHHFETAVTAAL